MISSIVAMLIFAVFFQTNLNAWSSAEYMSTKWIAAGIGGILTGFMLAGSVIGLILISRKQVQPN